MDKADIGLVGLAVMGQNLALNLDEKGYRVAVYNRSRERTEAFLATHANGTRIQGHTELNSLVLGLAVPRRILLMVKAGEAVDAVIDQLLPLLSPGDLIIDGGNSRYSDSQRRMESLISSGILFLGCGISGGEEGARHGPSIMPGGNLEAWPLVKSMLQNIAAQVDGVPCCQWVGEGGAGHYVKMVHNGIEYGDMQLIAEAWQFMRYGMKLQVDQIQQVFADWNSGVLDSYLIEITADILKARDSDGSPLVEKILDSAGQKGTGRWTGISALELGAPLTLIGEAVFARNLSALKEERTLAEKILGTPQAGDNPDTDMLIEALGQALYAAKIVSYAQGFMLMESAARKYGWNLQFGNLALMWRGGCIIRSRFLDNIKQAYENDPQLKNLMLDDFFATALKASESGWRKLIAAAIASGIPVPALSSGLAFFDGYRSGRSPANLIQAQRDYFGAHTYERVDAPRGKFFHTDWLALINE